MEMDFQVTKNKRAKNDDVAGQSQQESEKAAKIQAPGPDFNP